MEKDTQLKKRKGRFSLPIDVALNFPELVLELLGKMLIVRAETLYISDEILYDAYSMLFDEVDEGESIPIYEVLKFNEDLGSMRIEIRREG